MGEILLELLMAICFRNNWSISWKWRPVRVATSAPYTKTRHFIYLFIKLHAKKNQQDKNRSGEKRNRVGQIALWAWPGGSLARMLLAQVLSTKTKPMSKEAVYGSVPALPRRPDSGRSSWRAGLRQEMPNLICLSKWKLHPGLWSLVNCLDMKSVQTQPHAHMQSRAEGTPKMSAGWNRCPCSRQLFETESCWYRAIYTTCFLSFWKFRG